MTVSAQYAPHMRLSSPSLPGARSDSTPPSGGLATPVRGFESFDDALVGAREGLALILSPSRDVAIAHAQHAARRLESSHAVVFVSSLTATPLFVDVAAQLGLRGLADEPTKAARQLAQALAARRAAIIAPLPPIASWDRAVFVQLCADHAAELRARVLMFGTFTDAIEDINEVDVFELNAALTAEESRRWWHALSESTARQHTERDAIKLARWATLTQRRAQVNETSLSASALSALSHLHAVSRAWPTSQLSALGIDDGQVAELYAAGVIDSSSGYVRVREDGVVELPSGPALSLVADALVATFDDPWSKARAAELLLTSNECVRADAMFGAAMAALDDGRARSALSSQWCRTVSNVDDASAREQLTLSAAERSIAAGEAELAVEWAQIAIQLRPDSGRAAFLYGKALALTGEQLLAKSALTHALTLLPKGDGLVFDIEVELAELALHERDLISASEIAAEVLARCERTATALAATNVAGKVLLAKADWLGALTHFEADEARARRLGHRVEELRARQNRAVALVSMSRFGEAQALLESLLVDADAIGNSQAKALTHGNLAAAYHATDRGKALEHAEAACRAWQRIGNRRHLLRTLGNVAALRLMLGLVDDAASALAFSKNFRMAGLPSSALTFWKIVTARVLFAQGKFSSVLEEANGVIALADPGEGAIYLSEAHRLVAAVALEEGTLSIAREALEAAKQLQNDERGMASHALLEGRLALAMGLDAEEAARAALGAARRAQADDLVVEAQAFLARALLNRDAILEAQSHLSCAIALRDELAERLAPTLRAAFLGRGEFAILRQLQLQLMSEPSPSTREVMRPRVAVKREIVGDDPAIRALLAAVRRVARTSATILVRGESGTGKELLAEAIHRASDRASGPLVSVNCAALVETLLLSELFGHEKGAFTGATNRKRGRFELAEGGTLFLDEIGDISPRTQVALLRVLQEKTYERVGGTSSLTANVRIVCATHRDLRAMVDRGEFREDLYYRLRGITLELPALRNRIGDISRIAENLLARIAQERDESQKVLSSEAIELLMRHRWPGNIRELENALRAASLFSDSDAIEVSALTDNVDELRNLSSQSPVSLRPTLLPPPSTLHVDDSDDELSGALPAGEAQTTTAAYTEIRNGKTSLFDLKRQIERDCIARALSETKGNITRAAALLGMKRPRLSQLVKQYGFAAVSSEDGL